MPTGLIVGIRPRTSRLLPAPSSGAGASQTISPNGIASTAALGTPVLSPGAVTISPNGIASTVAFGTPTLTAGAVTVSPSGIASTAALGTPTINPGAVTVSPSGIGSTAGLGTPSFAVVPTGIASTLVFGRPVLTQTSGGTAADLVEAVADWLHADATLQALFSRLDFFAVGAAGRGDPLPRAVWVDAAGHVTSDAAPSGTGSDLTWVDTHTYQITVWAVTRAQARLCARAVAKSLEKAAEAGSLVFTEGTLLYFRRDGGGLDQLDPDKGLDGKDVWSHVIQFQALIESTDA